MSVIFGISRPPGSFVQPEALVRLASLTVRYGPDSTTTRSKRNIGMGFQAFHTHERSSLDQQPREDGAGNMVVLDGRLDNYRELCAQLGLAINNVDSVVILAGFAKWGPDCFSHLVGDWALALWSESDDVLYLARDHAGTRTLYYSNAHGDTTWSTYLEAFFTNGNNPEVNREYIARFIAIQELHEVSPFSGICIVPPAHYVVIRDGQSTLRPHWRWVADNEIVYKSEADYDEHFLHLFHQAVGRRLGIGSSVLAELSGGMDSSAIVCVADEISQGAQAPSAMLETVSYYDDTEPDWDERPFFTLVERQRNRTGIHIDCASHGPSYKPLMLPGYIYPYPGGDSASLANATRFEEAVGTGRYRAILSGIGGDELLGGIPNGLAELSNYVRGGQGIKLLTKAARWSLAHRRPLFEVLYDAIRFTASLYRHPKVDEDSVPSWLAPELIKLCLQPSSLLVPNFSSIGVRASALAQSQTWWSMLNTLPNRNPRLLGCYETRYPFLDRDLVDFLHRIPHEQLIQPNTRRLLMRRALSRTLPKEILQRRRKAFISHGPLSHLRNGRQQVDALLKTSLAVDLGLIVQARCLDSFHSELTGNQQWLGQLTRTIIVELWLRSLQSQHLLRSPASLTNLSQHRFMPS